MSRYGENTAKWIGAAMTVAAHLIAVAVVSGSGLKYIYPPPQETAMLLDFSEDAPKPVQVVRGNAPRSREPDRTKPVELVQKSQSPYESEAPNLTPATAPDPVGDIDVPTPEVKEEPKLDPRASFPGMSKKDTSLTAPHGADKATPTFKAGQADGNTGLGRTDGKPNAQLKGRNVVGNLPRPAYTVQESGIVVVTIRVDQYGNVQSAVPGADGTTVTDRTLWNASRKAAMETHFNMSADAPALQEGTITYIFKLK